MDATPLLGVRTGIGRYVEGLLDGFAQLADPPDVALAAFSRRRDRPASAAGQWVGPRVPARVLHEAWGRVPFPPVEVIVGRSEVVHGTNFVLPPRRHAAGVVTVHDLAFLLHPGTVTPAVRRLQSLVPRLAASADAVITPTTAVADLAAEHLGVAREQVHAVHHGVDPQWARTAAPDAAWRSQHGLPEHYLLFVGSREPRKDLTTLVAALGALPDPPTLVLAGPVGWGPEVEVPAGTVRMGFVEDDVLRSVVAGADTLVLPSRDEGFGLTALEALACGVPVVVSDLPALREVLGDHATYAVPGDPQAFAVALQSPAAGTRESRRAHAAAFTWQRCAEQTAAVYASVTR